uniref:Uncharacterized protein n=1 Tax=Oryza nivara TaxID=4536 RepID=A0A0E0I115_ORYNI
MGGHPGMGVVGGRDLGGGWRREVRRWIGGEGEVAWEGEVGHDDWGEHVMDEERECGHDGVLAGEIVGNV